MPRTIYVNLPVTDLERSKRFFTALGFSIHPRMSDDAAACVVVDETINVMLLTEAKFREFLDGPIADPATTEVINCLTAPDREAVDALVRRAIDAGAKPWKPTTSDGPMYWGSFQDPDGHVWEILAETAETAETPAEQPTP